MRETRTNEEHIIDQLLFLRLLDAMEQQSKRPERFQEIMSIMKAGFCAAWDMLGAKIKGFNLVFFTDKCGPLSTNLYAVRDSLLEAALIESRTARGYDEHRLTPKGRSILRGCGELLETPANQQIVQMVENAGQQIARLTSLQAMHWSHHVKVIPPSGWNLYERPAKPGESGAVNLGDLPMHTTLIRVLDRNEAGDAFEIDEDWYDTLEILFSPDYAPEAIRQASATPYEDLFADV